MAALTRDSLQILNRRRLIFTRALIHLNTTYRDRPHPHLHHSLYTVDTSTRPSPLVRTTKIAAPLSRMRTKIAVVSALCNCQSQWMKPISRIAESIWRSVVLDQVGSTVEIYSEYFYERLNHEPEQHTFALRLAHTKRMKFLRKKRKSGR